MKSKISSVLLAVCMVLSALLGLSSCNTTPAAPQKLSAPVVTLTDNIASWSADSNADKFEISIDENLSYVENSVTSKALADGQTFKLRAVGDGNNYSTSDWSNSVTYTAGTPAPQPVRLDTPAVRISDTGLASWPAVANASGYVYRIDGGAEISTAATSVQLADGQSIAVRAVGDGANYTDSNYSEAKTYTAAAPTPSDAPKYLGIFASGSEPSQTDGLPGELAVRYAAAPYRMAAQRGYRAFGAALDEYFADSNNHLGSALPAASGYELYARGTETVYVQIWLNNPSQHTILSLKLNGTKYQIGGGLSSFFIEDNGEHYNCVYVAVTIPEGAYTEQAYTVTDIEYIADTYINADGTDEFMNNNDTVLIGLPYDAECPTVLDFTPTSLTINSTSATLTLTDPSALVSLSGGWLGIAVYDGYDIVANQGLVIGNNTVSASGLVENTRYTVIAYLYADLHDGSGVAAHILFEQTVRTPEAITVEGVEGVLLYSSAKDGYYGAIKINTILNSSTAEYIGLEILDGEENVVYSDAGFSGAATVSNGILCGGSYSVRVYYKDTEYPEGKYVERNAWVSYLGTPWYCDADVYTLVNDAVYHFSIGNGDENYPAIDSFILKLYKEESARWVASDVLYILEHPTAIDDLNAQIDVLFAQMNELPRGEEMDAVYSQIQELRAILAPLEDAKWYLENRAGNNTDRSYWEAEAAKGKYYYTFEYNGTNTDTLFKVGKTYYAVLEDALTYGFGGLDIELTFKYYKLDGSGACEDTVNNQSINLDRELTNHWVEMENVSYSDGKLTLTLFNERDYWTGIGAPYAIGYVYKIEVEGEVVYLDESKHEANIDERAWFDEYIERIKAGESVDGLIEKYVPDYESSYTIPVDASKIPGGYRSFAVSIRLINTDYGDGECQATRWADRVTVYAQIGKPSIRYEELWGECYGVVDPEYVENWQNDHYDYEAFDKNGDPIEITVASESGYARFYAPPVGAKVRVRIPASGYWLESEWSEWYTFEGIKLPAPEFGEYDLTRCTIGWSFNHDATYVSHYVYTLNGGTPITAGLDEGTTVFLKRGDVLRVRCVPNAEGIARCFAEGEWAEYTCTDNRAVLSTPANLRFADKVLWWDAVDGAMYYVVEITYEGKTTERIVRSNYMAPPVAGSTYRVRALAADQESCRSSGWSESVTYMG